MASGRKPKQQFPMTADEFFEMPDDGVKYELVDGYLVAMAPTVPIHNMLQVELAYLIRRHLDDKNGSCWVGTEPGVQPKMQANFNVKIPDLGISCTPLTLTDKVMRDPVLLAEILSPSNVKETRASVWLYASIPSVREILLVHTAEPKLELFQRQSDGEWPREATIVGPGGAVQLACIGFELSVDELYRDTPLVR
jgi:Uma2 family endonuclease